LPTLTACCIRCAAEASGVTDQAESPMELAAIEYPCKQLAKSSRMGKANVGALCPGIDGGQINIEIWPTQMIWRGPLERRQLLDCGFPEPRKIFERVQQLFGIKKGSLRVQ
jgi:hypothetical protein